MAIPQHPDHRSDHRSDHHLDHPSADRDTSERAFSSRALPIVVLIVLLITVIATYYWYA